MARHTLSERVFLGESLDKRPSLLGMVYAVRDDIVRLIDCRFVVQQMVRSALRVRYQSSALGLVWTLLNPLLMLTVLSVVFSHVLRLGIDRYAVFLLPALVVWQFFVGSVGTCTNSLTSREGLIRKINVFLLLFPVADVAVAGVHALVALAVMFAIVMLFGAAPSITLVAVLPASLVLFAFVLGMCLIVTTISTFFRDVEHFISVVLQAAYFASPVMYPPETLPEELRWIMDVNPMRWIIELFRDPIYNGAWPSATAWLFATTAAVVSLCVGYSAYKRHESEFIFRL